MTQPTYEVNYEKLSSLSISDLIALYTYYSKVSHLYALTHKFILKMVSEELDKRVNDIIIF